MSADAATPWLTSLHAAARAFSSSPLLVAFSGGLDSTVLLHALAADPLLRAHGLRAIHVDHGLQADSGDWAEHCRLLCQQWCIPLDVQRVSITTSPLGPEGAAREARYAAFARVLQADETLVLAHQRDDQAETVLLRLLRASGSGGLSGMPATRALAHTRLWRPLLDVPRSALLTYAQQQQLAWRDDPSNQALHFDRNYLRHRVLPVLRARWPEAERALATSTRWLAEDAELLDEVAATQLASVQGLDPATLSVPALAQLDPRWRPRVVRYWLREQGLAPLPTRQLDSLLGPMLQARADAVPVLCWSGVVLRRWQQLLWLERELPPWPTDWQQPCLPLQPVTLPDGRQFQLLGADRLDAPLRVRARRGGERLRLPGRTHHSALKQVLQDLQVPPWQRSRLPLLFTPAGELLAAGDIVHAHSMIERGWRWQLCRQPRHTAN